MKDIVIHGATFNSNFGDVLFAHLFYNQYINDGYNVDLLQVENGRPLCDFVRNELNYHNILSYEEALNKDALVLFSGGMFGQPLREFNRLDLAEIRYNTFVKPLLDFQSRGKKTFIIGVGGSYIYNTKLREDMVRACNNANYVSFRNIETYDYFEKHGVKNAIITSDTAQVIRNILPKKISSKKTILLHIHQAKSIDTIFSKKVIPGIKRFISQHPEYDIVVSTCQVIDNLHEYDSIKVLGNYIQYDYNNSWELCSVIAGADIVITTALHVGIVACTLGKSVLSFGNFYEKIYRYYKQIGELDRCVDLKKTTPVIVYNLLNKYYNIPVQIPIINIEQASNNLNILKELDNENN